MVRTNARFNQNITELEKKNSLISLKAAYEGIVLLENDNTLPLNVGNIALYGSGAATTIKGGTGSGEVNERTSKTILEGLEEVGFTVTTKDYLEEYKGLLINEKNKHNKGIISRVIKYGPANIMGGGFVYPSGRLITDSDIINSNTDTCIYVVARQAGESTDRDLKMFHLDDIEISNLKKVCANYKKVILVINVGGPIDLSPIDDIKGIGAVIFYGYLGQMGGLAFAEIIKGTVSPSGCLSDTWPSKYDDIPFGNEYSYLKGNEVKELYKEDIYVGYRYFDSFNIKPRYHFGHGLTYADFACECLEVTKYNSNITIKVNVKNISNQYSGKKTIQAYVSAPSKNFNREYQMLCGFVKTKCLNPGEEEKVEISFDMKDIALYDEKNARYLLESGKYIIRLGFSSNDNKVCGVIELDEDIITEKCMNICPIKIDIDILKGPKFEYESYEVDIKMSSSDFVCINHNYSSYKEREILDEVRTLTLDELLYLVCGVGVFGSNNYFDAFGSAGFTTSKLTHKNIVNVALADGPAGLRIQKRTALLKNGKPKSIDAMLEFMNYLPKIVKKFLFASPEKNRVLYQYTTAFPVGINLAQTFNEKLISEVGEAIGSEMKEYGVTFWLAPGMNIHRNPLCGRNYEYYSEDPFLTGMVASSITKGVQSEEGCYVTIKHFAANNREFLRNKSDSILTERALREIYLKGFKMAVKKANAKSVMTSYNLINGIYTPNSYDLCTNVLRNEWGFDGVVMTDWLSTARKLGDNRLAIEAGNDLIMPGGNYYRKQIKNAIRKGKLSYDDLYRCASNVLKAIKNSDIQKKFDNNELNIVE